MLNLAPGRMLNDSGRDSPDDDDEDAEEPMEEEGVDIVDVDVDGLEDANAADVSMHESLTMEQFNSPLVESQYKSTYAIVANTGKIVTFFFILMFKQIRIYNRYQYQ